MKLDTRNHGIKSTLGVPLKHPGYSPVKNGKIIGRFARYDVAASKSEGGIIMTYSDAKKRGHS